jgi:hypothetical protein
MTTIIKILIILCGFFFAGCAPKPKPDESIDLAVARSEAWAVPIVQSLEQYHAAEGAYPRQLEELVPKYLKTIPGVYVGCDGWFYRAAHDSFELSLTINNGDTIILYDPRDKHWSRLRS